MEFATIMHCIFINRFMNKNERFVLNSSKAYISGDTIPVAADDEIEYMTKLFKYLDDWKLEIEAKNQPKWEFLDEKTYKNLHTGAFGFLYYARAILSP